ncbi:GGDEF domain-containing protein [Deinococcus ruber]|uniref:GGDEF domain-containing protein n=1 Tax=Deinococcus ruber TaxID=1848197 RepID=UPI00166E371A|nr:diguanylate cyclase [Deinococcus ruber]
MTLTFLLSLTYPFRNVPDRWQRPLRLMLFSVMGIVLMYFPAELLPGVHLDLRAVPVLLVTLEVGLLHGLGAAVIILSVRFLQGGTGVLPGVLALLTVTVTAGLARRYQAIQIRDLVTSRGLWALLLCLPYPLTLLLLPNGQSALLRLGGPLLLFNAAGLLVCASILIQRQQSLWILEQLTHQAERDALTGLANRRRFDLDLQRLGRQDALLLIDIDHFKRVNDTFGHAVGDEVLREVARCLESQGRARDTTYRYGGEEFAVILREIQPAHLRRVADRFRTAVGQCSMPPLNGQRITVSVGVAHAHVPFPIEDADRALYAAKKAGRNCVQLAPNEHRQLTRTPERSQ